MKIYIIIEKIKPKEVEMIEIEPLPRGKYLLGFSGGVDSSALFFLLLREGVEFDIAIVDYGVREQSKKEVAYAQRLACKYHKQCFCLQAPRFERNFESQARDFRYEFFSKLVKTQGYDGVVLAHQLDDRVEWMMMQFCKGAGVNTLLGFDFVQEVKGCRVYRPLWKVGKSEIYEYCKSEGIEYFEDESNQDQKYKRNVFRKILSALMTYKKGMLKSLEYLLEEKERLYAQKDWIEFGGIVCIQRLGGERDVHSVDMMLKQKGYILSYMQRKEIGKSNFSCEIGGEWVIESDYRRIYIAPKKEAIMSKEFRDFARRLSIPSKIRPNFFKSTKTREEIESFFA